MIILDVQFASTTPLMPLSKLVYFGNVCSWVNALSFGVAIKRAVKKINCRPAVGCFSFWTNPMQLAVLQSRKLFQRYDTTRTNLYADCNPITIEYHFNYSKTIVVKSPRTNNTMNFFIRIIINFLRLALDYCFCQQGGVFLTQHFD